MSIIYKRNFVDLALKSRVRIEVRPTENDSVVQKWRFLSCYYV